MTSPVDRATPDQRWVEAMFADLQRQIHELAGQLDALSTVVHAHTIRALRPRMSSGDPAGGDDA
jgi:hypothetical protein